ncbi:hypothetical protein M404DRAFT_999431 [Pisolithus tinctorius Marx 270]|uniref:Uncharacterized protein n=1 Tax=Pisolithus tinctorius Marx 270 TaxID=870435 RepID=A0A0C3K9D1_PISTI|nr:hypothetical protein M404DRAFT_999431 [Pisolithus tinctorius Marx 270]
MTSEATLPSMIGIHETSSPVATYRARRVGRKCVTELRPSEEAPYAGTRNKDPDHLTAVDRQKLCVSFAFTTDYLCTRTALALGLLGAYWFPPRHVSSQR